jgi:hypothetical protein
MREQQQQQQQQQHKAGWRCRFSQVDAGMLKDIVEIYEEPRPLGMATRYLSTT